MTKKQTTFATIGGIFLGIIGTAFTLGADKQRINDVLIRNSAKIMALAEDDKTHETATQKELDRLALIISAQMTLIQSGISKIDDTVNILYTDVKVLQTLMERVEKDIKEIANAG